MGAQRRTVTVYSAQAHPELADRLADWNVELRFDRLPEGVQRAFITVRQGERFLAGIDASVLADFFEPSLTTPGTDPHGGRELSAFLDHLDETLFHGATRRQLLAATREFEDRAWRVGGGVLRVGFQRPAALEVQRTVYRRLAERGLDVHVYFDGDWDTATIPGVRMHAVRNDEIGLFWFFVFDGGPALPVEADLGQDWQASQACALLAREAEPGVYSGFWTYDTRWVQALLDYLTGTYG